jgi:UDP-GlcNAc:undecaprenyl-phosphate GlcNAc-1-phosphate transferase
VLPTLDTTAAIVRRKLTGRGLCTTDRGHLHHCLLQNGLSNRRVLLLVSALSLLTVFGVLVSLAWKNDVFAVLSALAVVAVLVTTQLFGHAELVLVLRRGKALTLSLFSPAERPRQVEVHLQGSADWKELWTKLLEQAAELKLKHVRLHVNDPALQEGYFASWESPAGADEELGQASWHMEVPLAARGQTVGRLHLAGREGHAPVWGKLDSMRRLVEEIQAVVSRLADAQSGAAPATPPRPADPRPEAQSLVTAEC